MRVCAACVCVQHACACGMRVRAACVCVQHACAACVCVQHACVCSMRVCAACACVQLSVCVCWMQRPLGLGLQGAAPRSLLGASKVMEVEDRLASLERLPFLWEQE